MFARKDGNNEAVIALANNMEAVNQLFRIALEQGYTISDTATFTLNKENETITIACFATHIDVTKYNQAKVSGISFNRNDLREVEPRFKAFIGC